MKCKKWTQRLGLWVIAIAMGAQNAPAADVATPPNEPIQSPQVLVEGWELELVAREPEIVTPIAMTFDTQGRLLVVESHTHFRPEDYVGPQKDRIRALADTNGDGQLDRWTTFWEGSTATMGLAATSDGNIYAAARGELLRLQDTDGDGVADESETIVHLETKANYPHNGLGGICFVPPHTLYLGVGENQGFEYTLIGRRGGRLYHGAGQGGTVYAYDLSANAENEIKRIATGFWNPFALTMAPSGALIALDNDPDASPPCRLIHVVSGGDYGFKYQYGRNGLHPLQAWDGDLPGTLPMICGTGEAPSEIVAYLGGLWVTSWGDHTIERYRLVPRGQSFGAEKEVIVQGGADFRPVGMAVAPDGSIYFSDWVKRSYDLHHHGRIWRLRPTGPPSAEQSWPELPAAEQPAEGLTSAALDEEIASDPFRCTQWAYRQSLRPKEIAARPLPSGIEGLAELQARRLAGTTLSRELVDEALGHDSPDVRLFAVRWIADEHLAEFRDDVAHLLEAEIPGERYYLALLATLDWLSHPPVMTGSDLADGLLARELRNEQRAPSRHALALRLISPDHKQLTFETMEEYLASDYRPLRVEAVRTLGLQSDPQRLKLLAAVVADPEQGEALRADAIVGLVAAAGEYQDLLKQLATDTSPAIRREAERALLSLDPSRIPHEAKPPVDDLDAWQALLDAGGDPEAGRRVFFSAAGGRCAVCHESQGRGGRFGPELTTIGRFRTRRQLIQAILQPNVEIAPHFVPWLLETDDGKTRVGLKAPQGGDNGWETYYDANGTSITLASEQIVSRAPSDVSIMPSGLEQLMTLDDLRDLLAYLQRSANAAD